MGLIEPGENYHDLVLQSQSSMVECTPSGTGSSVVERLFYTQLVRGSNPFPCIEVEIFRKRMLLVLLDFGEGRDV